jgi:methyl-accepting chemotaxis protein
MVLKNRRQTYVIKKGFQFRYTALVLVMLLFVALFVSVIVSYSFITAMTTPKTFTSILTKNLSLGVLGLALIIGTCGIFYSHKIAGPMYRFEVCLAEIAKGNFSIQIRTRRGDELKSLEAMLNFMVSELRKLIIADKKLLSDVSLSLEELSFILQKEPISKEKLEKIDERLTNVRNECHKLISKYKV